MTGRKVERVATQRLVPSADGTPIGIHSLGSGPGLIVVGGALRTARDYLPLAAALASAHPESPRSANASGFTVHVVDRRGRGASGEQGAAYTLDTEIADLRAIQQATGARWAFGHSYGGLVVLETARQSEVFDRIAVYEPGLPVDTVPTAWMSTYQQRLDAGDARGAVGCFLRGCGGAPRALAALPDPLLRMVLWCGLRGSAWRQMRPLLQTNLREHQQLAAHHERQAELSPVTVSTLLLCGGRTMQAHPNAFGSVGQLLLRGSWEVLPGLGHFGPEKQTAATVARRLAAFFA